MKKFIIFLFIILILISAGFYFEDYILKDIKDFEKTDIGNLITEVSKEIFSPLPLQVIGRPNQVVLTKSVIFSETNLQRQNNSLPVLSKNAKLDAAALAKANDMFKNQYFEHMSPMGVDPGQLVLNYGYEYIVAGENLILGNFESEKELVQAWMDSPGHRANILNNRYSEIGIAIIKGTYKGESVWIGVQEFGLPSSTCAEPNDNLKNKIDLEKSQLDALLLQIDNADKNQVDQYNQLITQYNSLAEQLRQDIAKFNNQVNIFNSCVKGL